LVAFCTVDCWLHKALWFGFLFVPPQLHSPLLLSLLRMLISFRAWCSHLFPWAHTNYNGFKYYTPTDNSKVFF
jgi:hypothetical protein